MRRQEFLHLIEKYLQGNATEAEEMLLYRYYDVLQKDSLQWNEVELGNEEKAKQRLYGKILQEIAQKEEIPEPVKIYPLWKKLVAAILIIVGSGVLYYTGIHFHYPEVSKHHILVKNDIAPGGNKAYLTLANGKRLSLIDVASGTIAKESGVEISKTADGHVIYKNLAGKGNASGYNTMTTPKGGQYTVTLSDGTKVILNAASSLRYPATFGKERVVELFGEAYFEVAKLTRLLLPGASRSFSGNSSSLRGGTTKQSQIGKEIVLMPGNNERVPFIVKSKGQEVEVLGTHFNINSYTDEKDVRTTLLEGSVRVNRKTILKPGEQAALSGSGEIEVIKADVDDVIAWTNGKFIFENESIESIMRKLSRWYDVEVFYEGDVRDKKFAGIISRKDNISKILDKITFTQAAHFKIEGRRITVMP